MKSLLKKTIVVSVLSANFIALAPVAASNSEWYITPGINYIFSDDDRNAEDDFGLSIGVGKVINDHWLLETNFSIDKLDLNNGTSAFDQKALMLDAIYKYDTSANATPYALAGLGLIETEVNNGDSMNLAANVGVGYMKELREDGLKLRADIRYRIDTDDSIAGQDRYGDWIAGITLMYPFGKTQSSTVAKRSSSSTSQNAKVEKQKTTRSAVKRDSDKDGVADDIDQCKNTLSNVKVDRYGCEIISLRGVNFETNSAVIKPSSVTILDAAAKTLKRRSTIKVEVAGHTDSLGPDSYNQELSEKRAIAVMQYLIENGIDKNRLTAKGYGEQAPIASNKGKSGRAQNRRVELRLKN